MSYTAISMLETVARENDATADLIEYGKQELKIRHAELAYLLESAAAKRDVDLKNAQIAIALERIAGAQADMASFERRKKTILQPSQSDVPCRRRWRSGNWKIP